MKKIDCIIAIGCSHMFGNEHHSTLNNTVPSKDTYADLIGKHLGVPVYNFSQPGGSNQTILRRLLVTLEFLRSKKLVALFILQWTQFERYETLVSDTVDRSSDWPWLRTMAELTKKSGSEELTNWAKTFYRIYDSKSLLFESLKTIKHANLELVDSKHSVINCLAHGWDLDKYEFKKQKAYVSSDGSIGPTSVYSETLRKWYVDNNYILDEKLQKDFKVEAYENEMVLPSRDNIVLSLLWEQVEKYNWWFYNQGWTHGLKKYCIENKLEIGPDGHAMESAHEVVYQYMMNNNQFLNLID